MDFYIARRIEEKCRKCNFCTTYIDCAGEEQCSGCGACVVACPFEAKVLEPYEPREFVEIKINGRSLSVPARITILKALSLAGFKISMIPEEGSFLAPCQTGGCYSCLVLADGKPVRSCITPVKAGMEIETAKEKIEKFSPVRLISGFQPHMAGGVGTPFEIKRIFYYIEVACFAHGCILRCPTCQNWDITYASFGRPITPQEAAKNLTNLRYKYRLNRMAISGGESTLNRRWLIEFVKALKRLNPDKEARIHIDTNAVFLTKDYIDELIYYGMTDIGPDIKGLRLETFKRITNIKDEKLAKTLWQRNWQTVEYLLKECFDKIFVGVGIPYNKELISLDEIYEIGKRLASWQKEVQVCVVDYRPEFRRRDIERPSFEEMKKVHHLLRAAGLKTVICQTRQGYIFP